MKSITLIVNGEEREEQIQVPKREVLVRHFTEAPLPLTFDQSSHVWMRATLFLATNLSLGETKRVDIISGVHAIAPILRYWTKVITEEFNGEKAGEIKLPEEDLSFDSLDLNWDGSVDLEEMR